MQSMPYDELSRRALLQAIAAALGAAALPLDWIEVAAQGADTKTFFTAAETSMRNDVEAVAAQIIPTDDTPGAREAGVIHFIDRALATYFSQIAGDYRAQLVNFQARFRERQPRATSFAALTSAEHLGPRPADDDDSGAGVSSRRAHRAVRQAR